MATALDIRLLPRVKQIIDKYGKLATFTIKSAGSYAPGSGTVTGESVTTKTAKVSPPEVLREFTPGDVTKVGDSYVILPADDLSFSVALAMPVTMDNVRYEIIKINEVYSGELVCAYELYLRK